MSFGAHLRPSKFLRICDEFDNQRMQWTRLTRTVGRKAMKKAIGRIAVVELAGILFFELLSEASVHWRESSEELSMMALYVLLAAGLIWACLPAFPGRRMRILYRSVLIIALFLGTHTTIYFYSWHIRPNIGLYEEPEWVAQHPGFQEQLRARIERNKW